MKRYQRIAKLAELRDLARQNGQAQNGNGYDGELTKLTINPPKAYVAAVVMPSEFGFYVLSYECCSKVAVYPSLAHGFELEITGDGDKNEIGEVFSKWLNEEVK